MAFSLSRNFWLRGPIWLFNTIFRICRPRAFILDHKKGLFKHFKGVKSPEAATADLIRVVLAEILWMIGLKCLWRAPRWYWWIENGSGVKYIDCLYCLIGRIEEKNKKNLKKQKPKAYIWDFGWIWLGTLRRKFRGPWIRSGVAWVCVMFPLAKIN